LSVTWTSLSLDAASDAALVVIDGDHTLVWSRGDGPRAD